MPSPDADARDLIREARAAAGLHQHQLAKLASVSQPTLSKYETGRTPITVRELARILRVLGHELRLERV